ncbi:hypothetical protein MTO96_034639, partial [Rhipicephalus appendiculatus]
GAITSADVRALDLRGVRKISICGVLQEACHNADSPDIQIPPACARSGVGL